MKIQIYKCPDTMFDGTRSEQDKLVREIASWDELIALMKEPPPRRVPIYAFGKADATEHQQLRDTYVVAHNLYYGLRRACLAAIRAGFECHDHACWSGQDGEKDYGFYAIVGRSSLTMLDLSLQFNK